MDAFTPIDPPTPIETMPLFVTILVWSALSGMRARTIVDHIAKGNIVAHKVGGRTLIDVAASAAWIRSQPAPKVRLSPRPGKPRGRSSGEARRPCADSGRPQDNPHAARRELTDWLPDELTRLRALYAQTTPRLSQAEIGRKMGRSKASIQGKIWRLKLSRPPLRTQLVECRERGPPAVAQAA